MIDLDSIVDDESADAALDEWMAAAPEGVAHECAIYPCQPRPGKIVRLLLTRYIEGTGVDLAAAVRAALEAAGEGK